MTDRELTDEEKRLIDDLARLAARAPCSCGPSGALILAGLLVVSMACTSRERELIALTVAAALAVSR